MSHGVLGFWGFGVLGGGGPRRINQAPTGVPPFGTPCEANPNHRSTIARLLRRFRLFLCRPPCRINQAPTGVSPFGTARFTYVQRYATSVLLWGWGEGGRAGSTRHQLACLPLGHRASPTHRGAPRSSSCGVWEGGWGVGGGALGGWSRWLCGKLGSRSEPLVNNCQTPRAVLHVI